jgi:hypothetical protein
LIAEHTSINAYKPVRASTRLLASFTLLATACEDKPSLPRDGTNILSDVRVTVLTVVCEPCGRRERYDVESLKRQHGGDVKMPGLLAELVADCPKARSFSIYDRCKAVYERRG